MEKDEDSFVYLAFDEDAGTLLAGGATAVAALDRADRLAPDAAIYVIHAGKLGASIWECRLTLDLTRQITKHSKTSEWLKPPPFQPVLASWIKPLTHHLPVTADFTSAGPSGAASMETGPNG